MVSLRRNKYKKMDEGAKRRSVRILALEELKSDKAVLALPADLHFQQKRIDGHLNLEKRARRRTKEIEEEAQAFMNSPSAPRNAADRIIGYILDILEVKDKHELFSMPDNLQAYDYEESMKKPGDFATLRQKHTDKMYTTLVQFENDVMTVFHKVMDCNGPDSIPFREAMNLRDCAKKIFQSLRNNLAHAESELSSWHQKYFKYNESALQNDLGIGTSNNAPKQESSSNPKPRGRSYSTSLRRHSQPASSSRGRRAATIENEKPQLTGEQRRYTYKTGNDLSNSLLTTFCSEPKPLVYNNNTLSYQESLRRYVKDAGPIAKHVVDIKCHEYSKRVQAQSIWKPSPFGSESKIGNQPSFFPALSQNLGSSNTSVSQNNAQSSAFSIDGQQASSKLEHQGCLLHTDELLSLFSLIGTPDFFQRSLASNLKQGIDPHPGFSSFIKGTGESQSNFSSTKTIEPGTNFGAINELPIWQPRLSGSEPRKEREPTGPELDLCSEKEASSSVGAGFNRNKNYGIPSKPSNQNVFRGTM